MIRSIAAIHATAEKLGLDEDTRRAKMKLITGKTSTKDMSELERQKVLAVFRNEGFAPVAKDRRPTGRTKLSGPYAGKLQALWIAGWNLGVFRNRDDAAIISFVHGRTGLDAVRFLHHHDDANKAIEAIKAILTREAGVDWSLRKSMSPIQRAFGFKIAWAQWEKLNEPAGLFWPMVRQTVSVRPNDYPTDQQWILVMNKLGERIRAAKSGVVSP